MITTIQLNIRSATWEDRQKLANLIHFESYVHRHLDWRLPLDWIGSEPYLLAEEKGNLIAALASPPDPPHVAWIRLFAVAFDAPVRIAWDSLWAAAHRRLEKEQGVVCAAAISLRPWFQELLEMSGFKPVEQVVMLAWDRGYLPPKPAPGRAKIRAMRSGDLPAVHRVDTAAFAPIWQNSLSCLEMAFQQAAYATVAEAGGEIVAYQISTATSLGGHLARLAVLPQMQRQGIGYCLAYDLLAYFLHRRALRVTVNTQKENLASLALYARMGFQLTGEEYPVFRLDF